MASVVICHGDWVDATHVIGPFATPELADDWLKQHIHPWPDSAWKSTESADQHARDKDHFCEYLPKDFDRLTVFDQGGAVDTTHDILDMYLPGFDMPRGPVGVI